MLENKVVLSSAVVLVIASSLSLAIDSSVPFIHADDVHSLGITGQGITVVVIDTGVDLNHPGLSEGIAPGGLSIVNSVLIKDDGADVLNDSHGTQMSLIITDSAGVAPAARILPVRVLGHGGINPFDVVRAIEYVTPLVSGLAFGDPR